MQRRRKIILAKLVYWMCLSLLLAFAFVLLSSLGTKQPSPAEQSSSPRDRLIADVAVGATVLRRYQGKRVWVSHFSDTQQRNGAQLSPFVQTQNSPCALSNTICVLDAATQRAGVELRFSATAPAQLPRDLPWHGGFVDPNNGRLFDLWGRAYAFQNTAPKTTHGN